MGCFHSPARNRFLWCLLWPGCWNTIISGFLAFLLSKASSYRDSQSFQILLYDIVHSFVWLQTPSEGYYNISSVWMSQIQVHFFTLPVLAMCHINLIGNCVSSIDWIVFSVLIVTKSIIFRVGFHLKSTLNHVLQFGRLAIPLNPIHWK